MEQITILMAEDHVVVRESIRRSLERDPNLLVVGEASDGEEAVEMARRLKPKVIIMDMSMPKLNGIEATRRIKKFQPQTAILILTAYDYEQYIFPLLEAGAAGYLLKDISSSALIDAVKTVYKGESVLHPAVARKVMERFRHAEGELQQGEPSELFTQREIVVLKLAAKGMSNSVIAEELHLSTRTIESHLSAIFNKLGVGSRMEAVLAVLKRGWLTLDELF